MSTVLLLSCVFTSCFMLAQPVPMRPPEQVAPDAATINVKGLKDASKLKTDGPDLAAKTPDRSEEEGTVQRMVSWKMEEMFQKPDAERHKHEVEHVGILKNERFWILMGAVIVTLAGIVIKIEVSREGERNGNQKRENSSSDSSDDEPNERSYVHMVLTVVALYVAMLLWGITQEYVMSQPYISANGRIEKYPSSLALVLWNRLVSVVFMGTILKIVRKPLYYDGFWVASLPATTNAMASWCQYDSLHYVSFALQVTVKSTKLVPVVLFSSLRGKKHTIFDYMEVCVLALSLVVFGTESESQGETLIQGKLHGLLLLGGLVLFDAMTPHLQDYMFKAYDDVDATSVQFAMSSFAAGGVFLVMLCLGDIPATMGFLNRHPIAMLHMSVLALCSTITQYLITYTIKMYGPVGFTVIQSVRQVFAVLISCALFGHEISALALLAMFIVFCVIMSRAVRQHQKYAGRHPALPDQAPTTTAGAHVTAARPDTMRTRVTQLLDDLAMTDSYSSLLVCALSIHVCFGFYAIAQEFLAIHSFEGKIFSYPMFLVAGNHTLAALFAGIVLKAQNVPIFVEASRWSLLPAGTNLCATYLQHAALYMIYFPAQTLMKSLKIIPVMLVGRVLRNRTYTLLDYVEALVITILVAFFVWDFEVTPPDAMSTRELRVHAKHVILGISMMVGYLVLDAGTVNAEDIIYQKQKIDPGQMLVGMEASSGLVAWTILIVSGEANRAFTFLRYNGDALLYASLLGLAMASAVGAYTCVLTVRLFGPVVFSLLMLCRQILSLVFSVILFQHKVNWQSCLALVIVCNLVLLASIRRVAAQLSLPPHLEDEKETAEACRIKDLSTGAARHNLEEKISRDSNKAGP